MLSRIEQRNVPNKGRRLRNAAFNQLSLPKSLFVGEGEGDERGRYSFSCQSLVRR